MRKLTIIILMLLSVNTFAQTINGMDIGDLKNESEYIQILGTSKLLSSKVTITIDFGQRNKLFSGKDDGRIVDKNGKSIVLNSMIDAINFMSENGYVFVNAYAITIGNQNVYHYMMKRKSKFDIVSKL
jgi:hypothetical protein